MHHLDLILTLTGGLATALVLGYLTHRLGLSPIVGYLVGGIAVGPHTPGFVANQALAEQLAEVGVILLMFGVGLSSISQSCWPCGVSLSLGPLSRSAWRRGWALWWLGCLAGTGRAGIVFGLALSVASTVVLMRVLADHRDLAHADRPHRGWLAGGRGPVHRPRAGAAASRCLVARQPGWALCPWPLALAALKLTVLVGFTLLVGGRLIPWLLERVASHPLTGVVHPDHPGAGARHCGRLGHAVRGLHGAGRLPRRDGGGAVGF